MAELSQGELLQLVNSTQCGQANERVREITLRVVSDLFRTIDELDVTPDEFWIAVDWLTRLGQSGQTGLITAGLGFDRLLDIRADEADRRAGREAGTPRAIEGPLYVPGAPLSDFEARVDREGCVGDVLVMEGAVIDTDGQAIPNAIIEVWHADAHGRYSHFAPGLEDYELRRKIQADEQGRYRFRTYIPPGYSIPPDSPTSELFSALGRHGNRPAHIHFLCGAPGFRTLTTQVNIPGDTYVDDDFAFATRDGLVVTLEPNTSPVGYESLGVTEPFTRTRFDFVMQKATSEDEAAFKSRMERVA